MKPGLRLAWALSLWFAWSLEVAMLRIYDDVHTWARSMDSVLRSIARHDSNLSRQLRRAVTSVCLNVGEGMGACEGSKRQAYRVALKEMRETASGLRLAASWGYIARRSVEETDLEGKITAQLIKLAKPGR